MITNCKNILVLAPHTDDGELGLGGTVSRLIEDGKKVTYVAFSTAQQSVPEGFPKDILKTEVKQATQTLGIVPENLIIYNYEVRKLGYARQEILEELIRLKKASDFDLVFIPSLHDIHQDHTTIAQEGLRAFKNTNILGYELIWNNLTFNTQCFVKLEKRHIDTKIESLKAYKSQGARDYLSEDFIYSLARARGVQAGCTYAEAFEVIRLFL
ncbi:PIG-L family deacetylase [uncultured Parabacteroides sp.]|uniref:PIG-L deacetylase family protein n=1 Tax=uncultured Parabacteroides sp. TaxID=512312 RepID=UPI00260489E1|nr:PIG-L family deacetylase [uncultured Parabacteroides sp.]